MSGSWLKDTFAPTPGSGDQTIANYTNISISEDFFKFISENALMFYDNKFIGMFIAGVFTCILYFYGAFAKNGILNSGDGIIFLILFVVYITNAIKTIRKG
jgi:hypothetical protein